MKKLLIVGLLVICMAPVHAQSVQPADLWRKVSVQAKQQHPVTKKMPPYFLYGYFLAAE